MLLRRLGPECLRARGAAGGGEVDLERVQTPPSRFCLGPGGSRGFWDFLIFLGGFSTERFPNVSVFWMIFPR